MIHHFMYYLREPNCLLLYRFYGITYNLVLDGSTQWLGEGGGGGGGVKSFKKNIKIM